MVGGDGDFDDVGAEASERRVDGIEIGRRLAEVVVGDDAFGGRDRAEGLDGIVFYVNILGAEASGLAEEFESRLFGAVVEAAFAFGSAGGDEGVGGPGEETRQVGGLHGVEAQFNSNGFPTFRPPRRVNFAQDGALGEAGEVAEGLVGGAWHEADGDHGIILSPPFAALKMGLFHGERRSPRPKQDGR